MLEKLSSQVPWSSSKPLSNLYPPVVAYEVWPPVHSLKKNFFKKWGPDSWFHNLSDVYGVRVEVYMWQWETTETIQSQRPPHDSSGIICTYETRQAAPKWAERRNSKQLEDAKWIFKKDCAKISNTTYCLWEKGLFLFQMQKSKKDIRNILGNASFFY